MSGPPPQDVEPNHSTPIKAPDGGWGWVVTFSSFMIHVLVDGTNYTYGLFSPEFLRHFGESKGKTQLIHALMVGIYLVLGPFVSALMNTYGSRRVVTSGAVIASAWFFLASFSPNLNVMIFFYSVVGGTGFGLMYLPSIVIICSYFDKRRSLATGMSVCGAGVGGFVFAPLSTFLLETYGWRGTMWIISAIIFNGVVLSAAYRPLETSYERNITKTTKSEDDNSDTCCHQFCFQIKDSFDFSLLKSPTMLLYGSSCLFVMFGYFIPTNFLPAWAYDVNLTTDEGAFLIVLFGISTTITRVGIGYITDKPCVNSLIINNTALLVGGVSTCLVPFYTTFVTLSIYSVLIAAVFSTFACLRSIVLSELLGVHRLPNSFGLIGLSMGISTIVGSPLAGALSDISGNYNMAFYFGGITLGLGGLICIPLRRISEWEKRRSIDINIPASSGVNEKDDKEKVIYIHNKGYKGRRIDVEGEQCNTDNTI